MKQWVYKVDTPNNKKGDFVNLQRRAEFDLCEFVYFDCQWIKPKDYLDIFEQVEVKSDENILKEYLDQLYRPIFINEIISKNLLSQNAIKEEFLQKLRKGEK